MSELTSSSLAPELSQSWLRRVSRGETSLESAKSRPSPWTRVSWECACEGNSNIRCGSGKIVSPERDFLPVSPRPTPFFEDVLTTSIPAVMDS